MIEAKTVHGHQGKVLGSRMSTLGRAGAASLGQEIWIQGPIEIDKTLNLHTPAQPHLGGKHNVSAM